MLWLRRFSLKQRLGMIVALVVVILLVLTSVMLSRHYDAQKEKAQEETMHLVEVVYTLLGSFAEQQRAGVLSEQEAQAQALSAVNALRYDTDNYFWIQSDLPAMIMHPFKPALNGQDLSAFKDGNGKQFFKEMATVVNREGDGFVPYVWPLPGEEAPTAKISYVKRFAPWGWTIGTGVYLSRLDASFAHMRNIFIALGIISVVLVIVAAYLIGRSIVQPLEEVTERMKDIAQGEGDLTRTLSDEGQDEVARLSRYFNRFVSKMRDSLVEVKDTVEEVSENARLLAAASQRSNTQSESQSSSTFQVASAMEQMTTQIHDVSSHAMTADNAAVSARQNVSLGTAAVKQTVAQINSLTGNIESVSTVVTQLAQQSEKIGLVLDVIRGIAEQTNLLALNAAIEAARAGEQGRGFAVVADEVRTLASRTGHSTDEIRAMIQQLQAGAQAAVDAVRISQAAAGSTVDNATEANHTLQTLDNLIADISSMNSQIARATEQQADAANEVNLRVNELSNSAEHNLSTAAELATASEALERSATVMREIVERFKL